MQFLCVGEFIVLFTEIDKNDLCFNVIHYCYAKFDIFMINVMFDVSDIRN